jgi:hypothetical protein
MEWKETLTPHIKDMKKVTKLGLRDQRNKKWSQEVTPDSTHKIIFANLLNRSIFVLILYSVYPDEILFTPHPQPLSKNGEGVFVIIYILKSI